MSNAEPLSNDGNFHVTSEGDVVPAYEGVNRPTKKPQEIMHHLPGTIAGISADQAESDVTHNDKPVGHEEVVSLTDEERAIGLAGVAKARKTLRESRKAS